MSAVNNKKITKIPEQYSSESKKRNWGKTLLGLTFLDSLDTSKNLAR